MTERSRPGPPRSFVRRTGRVTRGQARALRECWPRYGLCNTKLLNLRNIFGREAPCIVAIGFGMGEDLADLARSRPEQNFIGIEVHEAGIGRLLSIIEARAISNLRVLRGDAAVLLRSCFEPGCLAAVLLYFPDPWPKKRHHKRRLVQPGFVSQVAAVLAPGGQFRLATDWPDYARQMLRVIEASGEFRNLAGSGCFLPDSGGRGETRFERRGQRLGHEIFDLAFVRAPD